MKFKFLIIAILLKFPKVLLNVEINVFSVKLKRFKHLFIEIKK